MTFKPRTFDASNYALLWLVRTVDIAGNKTLANVSADTAQLALNSTRDGWLNEYPLVQVRVYTCIAAYNANQPAATWHNEQLITF